MLPKKTENSINNGRATTILERFRSSKPAGVDLSRFKDNPVAFWNHDRSSKPIGRWDNVRKDGDRLLGTLVLDDSDNEAVQIANKIEKGIINTVSIGGKVITWGDDDILPNQKYETVAEMELWECSVCDIPANKNSIRLYAENIVEDVEITLSTSDFPVINKDILKKIVAATGLKEEACEQDVINLFSDLEKEKEAVDTALAESVKENTQLSAELKGQNKKVSDLLIKLNENRTPLIGQDNWSWDDYQQKAPDELELMYKNDFENYQKLYFDKYKVYPK